MSNYNLQQDKISVHLTELRTKHKVLDTTIKQCYNERENDEKVNRLKTEKLWLKDEIHRLESELKELR